MAHTFAEFKDHCPVSPCWSKTTRCSAQMPFLKEASVPGCREAYFCMRVFFFPGLSPLEAKVYSPRATPYSAACSAARSVGCLNRSRKQGSALCGLSHGFGEYTLASRGAKSWKKRPDAKINFSASWDTASFRKWHLSEHRVVLLQ